MCTRPAVGQAGVYAGVLAYTHKRTHKRTHTRTHTRDYAWQMHMCASVCVQRSLGPGGGIGFRV